MSSIILHYISSPLLTQSYRLVPLKMSSIVLPLHLSFYWVTSLLKSLLGLEVLLLFSNEIRADVVCVRMCQIIPSISFPFLFSFLFQHSTPLMYFPCIKDNLFHKT
uniref:Uncharacterized protein n=1 Tax=Cacopsylla melanoneura TaxID=428564 RepID=A0A8D8WNR5_9HEMI